MAQSLAYQYALENQGIDAMYDSIRSFMANNPSPDQIKDAMATYGISPDDVVSATGSYSIPVYVGETEQGSQYDYVAIQHHHKKHILHLSQFIHRPLHHQ